MILILNSQFLILNSKFSILNSKLTPGLVAHLVER